MTDENPQRMLTVGEAQSMIATALHEQALRLARAPRPFKVFGLSATGTNSYATQVADHLGVSLTPHTEKTFDDGEAYVKSGTKDDLSANDGNVRGHDVFVIQSLYSDASESVNDKLVKLCWMGGSLKDASAAERVAVIPYLGYARQDRKTESRAPISTKYLAKMLESVGFTRVVFFDVHNLAAVQNAFTIPVDNLEAKNIFADWHAEQLVASKKIRVLTPDSGGLNRCIRFRNALVKRLVDLGRTGMSDDDIEIAIFDKVRQDGKVVGDRIIGDVQDADVIAYDDMIATAGTMNSACKAVTKGTLNPMSGKRENIGKVFSICSTHYLGVGKANKVLKDLDDSTRIVVADTVDPFRMSEEVRRHLVKLPTTKMMADAIARIHNGTGSISELLT